MDEKVKIYLVEDDAIIRLTLKIMLESKGFEIIGEADEAEVALKEIKEIEPDLAILDINLIGDKDGIWLAYQIREHLQMPIVFLTAFGDEHTFESVMKTKPNGFLSKPFKEPDIFSAVHIALDNFSKNEVGVLDDSAHTPSDNMVLKDCLFIKDRQLLIKLKFDDIIYLKSDGNYIDIIVNKKKYLVRDKLVDFLSRLPENKFIQVHQRYLVSISNIEKVGNGFLIIKDEKIPVSKSYSEALYKITS